MYLYVPTCTAPDNRYVKHMVLFQHELHVHVRTTNEHNIDRRINLFQQNSYMY